MLRVVFDTVIFVRALINPYSFCGRLLFAHTGRCRLVLSRPVVEEIIEVLHRPELSSKFRTLPGRDLRTVLDLAAQAELVGVESISAVSRDPNDDKFLATARVASADYLVSEDQDLLVLGEYEQTKIVNAATFIALLERGQE